ncbi:MAG: hypothetical protein LIP16_00095 [Clostridium sp.]|nr:hypothetical protein [Clostridium sp.]
MKLSRYEQETVINYNVADTEASVYTADSNTMKRMVKLVAEFPEIFRVEQTTEVSKTYLVPKNYVKIRKPRRISEEHKEQARRNMKQINLNGKNRE